MTENDRVDPRYDPAFQRGYEGEVTSGLRARGSVRRSALVSPASYRSAERDPSVDTASDAGNHTETDETESSAATGDPAATEELSPRPVTLRDLTRNPFVVALVVLGLGMTIGGAGWANQARLLVAARGGASTELDYWFLQASVVAAPLTILAGIGILAGVMFIAAGVWNRRPR